MEGWRKKYTQYLQGVGVEKFLLSDFHGQSFDLMKGVNHRKFRFDAMIPLHERDLRHIKSHYKEEDG